MKTFKIILICIFSATLAFVAFRSSLRGTKAIYETTQPQYREIKEEINISGNVFPTILLILTVLPTVYLLKIHQFVTVPHLRHPGILHSLIPL